MAIDVNNVIDRLSSHAQSTGHFDRVQTFEPTNRPGRGLTCGIWIDRIEPASGMSGLNKTTVRAVFTVRLYSSMLSEPRDLIDPNLIIACQDLMEAYTNDFDLGDTVKMIDLLGASQGHPLSMQSGYIEMDAKVFRVLTITVPVVLNDVWTQGG
jgi:hypothetical protein